MVIRSQVPNLISLPVGFALILTVPVDLRSGKGHFPTNKEVVLVKGVEKEPIYGFVMEFDEVGDLFPEEGAVSQGDIMVKYVPKKSSTNSIYFFTSTGLVNITKVVPVPIHDHSSIPQGGPAFGTYASSYNTEEEEPMEDNI